MNIRLAAYLALRSLRHHRTVAIATIAGVAIGMAVVAAILIVDHHSPVKGIRDGLLEAPIPGGESKKALRILRVAFERNGEPQGRFPTQEGRMPSELSETAPPPRRGEEDYQAMRMAVRLASLLAFSIGAVIVFYTMRFSVAARSREFCLLLCLGERRTNVVLSLLLETLVLGTFGTVLGLIAAFPAAALLIRLGISTTGRVPTTDLTAPWPELAAIAALSVTIALLAIAAPARAIYRMSIVDVLQPRFLSTDVDERSLQMRSMSLLLPPLMAAAYIAMRPFMLSWLSVVQFFLLESVFALALALAVLWWMPPLLRALIRVFELGLTPTLPLETLLAGRRMRLTSRTLVFTISGITLVFSLLTALHNVTRALKYEIERWAAEALTPCVFVRRNGDAPIGEAMLRKALEEHNLYFFRLSDKVRGELPMRLIAARDVNPFLEAQGRAPLRPGTVIVSRTLAARFALSPGDIVIISADQAVHRFVVINVTDTVGFFAESDQYVDLKSYLLFSDGNSLFVDSLERTLDRYGVLRQQGSGQPGRQAVQALYPFYIEPREGRTLNFSQKAEIDRDFLIFDFILAMTVVLATLGVTNNILIQVHARRREFSVLRTLGVARVQTMRLLLVEGSVIGLVAALLALILGNAMGAISVSFLDRFTLFEYQYVFSLRDSVLISMLSVITCSLAAVYPALVANRISSAESLHYE